MNVLFIGKTYVRMKQNDKAKEVCFPNLMRTTCTHSYPLLIQCTALQLRLGLLAGAVKIVPNYSLVIILVSLVRHARRHIFLNPLRAQYLLRARDWEQKTADDKRAHDEAVKLLKEIGYKEK